jgi:septin 7
MLSTISPLGAPFALVARYLVKCTGTMASTLLGRYRETRLSRSESASSSLAMSGNENEESDVHVYPGSLHRNQRIYAVPGQYRSMPNIEDPPSFKPIPIPRGSSLESWANGKPNQDTQQPHSTWNDGANMSSFCTATNGVAPAAPTRAPAPIPNGKAASPVEEIPQSVSSTDPKIAAQQATDMRNIVRRKLTGYVGFANLPNQWHRKSVRKGFNFNVMVVGRFPLSHKAGTFLT